MSEFMRTFEKERIESALKTMTFNQLVDWLDTSSANGGSAQCNYNNTENTIYSYHCRYHEQKSKMIMAEIKRRYSEATGEKNV